MNLGRLIHHLVHDQPGEIAEHDVDHRTHTGHRRADADAGEAGFRDRRVEHAVGAELLHQAAEHLERRAGFGHVFAHDEDARDRAASLPRALRGQLRPESVRERLQQLQAYTSCSTLSTFGYGAAMANCTALSISAFTSA